MPERPDLDTSTGGINASPPPTRPLPHFPTEAILEDSVPTTAPSAKLSRTSMRKRSVRKRPPNDSDSGKDKFPKMAITFSDVEEKLHGGGDGQRLDSDEPRGDDDGDLSLLPTTSSSLISLETKKRKREPAGSGQGKLKKPTLIR